MRIAVLGGGNGSFAAAGDFALAGHDTRLWRRDRDAVEAHRAAGSAILIKDFSGQRVAKLSLVTNDIAEAVRERTDLSAITPRTGGVGPLTVSASSTAELTRALDGSER